MSPMSLQYSGFRMRGDQAADIAFYASADRFSNEGAVVCYYSPREPTDALIVTNKWLEDNQWHAGLNNRTSRLRLQIVAF